jgi:ABC-type polysaccharide/polyol phosphate transport system ATPase subunit
MAIIEVNHVTKEFRLGQMHGLRQTLRNGVARLRGKPVEPRPPFKALDDVDFKVEQGEVLGIIGHNGAGKSTLLKLLAGISRPTHGSVSVHGRVAPLIEVGAGLVPDLTGRENIYLNATILGMKRAEIKRKFDEIVAFAELGEFIDTPVKRYSSGMMVRLGFSIATSVAAEILIVDEVLAVGDLAFQRKCFDRMESLIQKDGRTVLLVSHNIRQVERLCSRVMLVDKGKLLADGTPKETCNFFYERSDETIKKVRAASAGDARYETSGDVELLSVALLDASGRATDTIVHKQDIHVVVTYELRRQLPRPVFGVGIHTTDFLYLATSQSTSELSLAAVEPGVHQLTCSIKSFPFLPGVYSLRLGVALGATFTPTFYAENVLHFQVVAGELNRASTSHPQEGFIALDTSWAIQRETATLDEIADDAIAARH